MSNPFRRRMTNARLGQLIKQVAGEIDGELGYWQFTFDDRTLMCITDESHNRMRVMAPIVPTDDVAGDELPILLEANFDRALDAKFAIASDLLWSVFTHPLKELTDRQFLDAVKQVATLADNYGTTYTSSDLLFGGSAE